MKIIKILLATLVLCSCSNPSDAERTLDDMGFTDIKTGGFAWFSCGEDDFYRTTFSAKNTKGKEVQGAVCSGLFFKNSTVRFGQ